MEENKKICKYCQSEVNANVKVCPNRNKKLGTKWWQIVLIVLGGIVVWRIYFGIFGTILKSDLNISTTSDSDIASNSNQSQTKSNYNTQTQNKIQKTEFIVGEAYEGTGMTINYVSCDSDFKGYSQYASLKDGCKVVKLEFEFANTYSIDSDIHPSSFDFKCYADGYACDKFYSVDDSSFYLTLSKGKKGRGNVYYEVPVNAQEIIVEYETSFWTNKKISFIVR